ncbi:tRNA dimethylallyltransferase 2-like [Carica papaya]|uniref:tRNA dimethylallyltransferase 2-like n=1 Tax=Carica papaya TaxID=3649 RepID=UPI000B8C75CB|nr:tRNA dimethylallyltransferase 2-like [Carica papaya]
MDGPAAIRSEETLNPNNGGPRKEEEAKPKVVVIMGPTGSGKSKLAIDLASHFPIEIINSDSMQVYRGLDVLTNKVPLHEQKGVKHHLLGTVSPDVEFTVKDFRNAAIPIQVWMKVVRAVGRVVVYHPTIDIPEYVPPPEYQ